MAVRRLRNLDDMEVGGIRGRNWRSAIVCEEVLRRVSRGSLNVSNPRASLSIFLSRVPALRKAFIPDRTNVPACPARRDVPPQGDVVQLSGAGSHPGHPAGQRAAGLGDYFRRCASPTAALSPLDCALAMAVSHSSQFARGPAGRRLPERGRLSVAGSPRGRGQGLPGRPVEQIANSIADRASAKL